MIDAFFFDVGNTLLEPHPSVSEVVRQILAEEGHIIDLSSIDEYMPLVDAFYEDRYREDDTFWTDESETSAVWVGMYALLARKLGIHADAERIAARVYDEFGLHSRWRAYSDVVPALERLRRLGMRIGIISNWDRRLSSLIDGLGIGRFVDVLVCSADVGLRKPDPRIFELACARAGVIPERCVHVGDHHYADIVGARAVGMTAVLIDRHDGARPRHDPFIRTLNDLEPAVGLMR